DARVAFLAVDSVPADAVPAAFIPVERCFPTLADDRSAVAARYSAATGAFPMVVIIDPRGLVRYRGPFDDNPDLAFATRSFCADTVRDLLGGAVSDDSVASLRK